MGCRCTNLNYHPSRFCVQLSTRLVLKFVMYKAPLGLTRNPLERLPGPMFCLDHEMQRSAGCALPDVTEDVTRSSVSAQFLVLRSTGSPHKSDGWEIKHLHNDLHRPR